eukprot:CAMPEP_0167787558 /NCGR_PEP_ID=MMETSP0111_2-20121227/9505_1 /TAXON_ID=91324 /ORGANISM="Lotharella globosa, Strain CCCM811" /LENGTH=493 /DNA_ID=CAMNT_0007679245 /DNA_START=114 /DNA_END=1595 /DNA_ORIENTATION=+
MMMGGIEQGYLCSAMASVLFAMMYLPVKYYPTYDGITFQWFMCAGVWTSGFVLHWASGYGGFTPHVITQGVLGGGMWAMANYIVVPVMQLIGLGLGFSAFNVCNLCVGYAVGRFGLFGTTPDPATWLGDIGLGFLVVSFIFMLQVTPNEEKDNEKQLPDDVEEAAATQSSALDSKYGSVGKSTSLVNPVSSAPSAAKNDAGGDDAAAADAAANGAAGAANGTSAAADGDKKKNDDHHPLPRSRRRRKKSAGRGQRRENSTLLFGAMPGAIASIGEPVDDDSIKAELQRRIERGELPKEMGSTVSSLSEEDEIMDEPEDGDAPSSSSGLRRMFGFLLALISGALMGTNLLPFLHWQHDHPDAHPWNFVMAQTTGAYFMSTIIYLTYAIYARIKQNKVPHSGIRPAFISGVIWSMAFALNLVALRSLGYSTGYTLGSIGPVMLTSGLSYAWFGEITDPASVRAFFIALVMQCIGVACVAAGRGTAEAPTVVPTTP